MTIQRIEEEKARAGLKYDVARQIRELLDAARKTYGSTDWDAEDLESQVLELVSEE